MAMNINLRSGSVWNPAVWQIVNNTVENHTACIFRMKKKKTEGSPWHHISPKHNLKFVSSRTIIKYSLRQLHSD
jgi:hypothetical protein